MAIIFLLRKVFLFWNVVSFCQTRALPSAVTSRSWSWSSCGRQSVDQFVWVSGLPLGPLTRFYLALLFSADKYVIILSKASSLTRKRVCSLQCNHSLVPITVLYRLIWDCVPFLSPLTTRRGYGGGILTRLHTGLSALACFPLTTYWEFDLTRTNREYHVQPLFYYCVCIRRCVTVSSLTY
jgi:hypothetical protein